MTFEDDAVNATCGKIYTPSWSKENITVDWKWFPCKERQKCIHIDNRCNLHPHPDCLYEKVKILKESVSSSQSSFLYFFEFFFEFNHFQGSERR